MLRFFRVRAWCLATVLFLVTGTAGTSLDLLLHGDASHSDPCAPPVIVAHDAAAHSFTSPPDDRADAPGAHCVACHLARALRLRSEPVSLAAHVDDGSKLRVPPS